MWTVNEVTDPAERQAACNSIITQLPAWFGIPSATERYIREVADEVALVIHDDTGAPLGMLSLRHPFPNNADILWLGVLSDYHRSGMGRALVEAAIKRAKEWGCKTLTVETLGPSHPDEGYRRTRAFYAAMGFEPLFELAPYGPDNPQIYLLMQLGDR